MNKKLLSLTCILFLAAIAVVLVLLIQSKRDTCTDATDGLHTNMEGETYMAYEYGVPRRISASRARAIMQANPYAIILDVRTQQEYDNERIPGAILLPDYAVSDLAAETLPDKNATILVYCRAGRRSQSAASILVEMGYVNVYDFGGIDSWPYERE
ncbi:MAG: rhodanese-like domain-containing protein [Defluviitaleaceae bacterium]|nr:rhodanese-like domain-containing protein [Defluviitaleaceae bacterium]